MEPPAMEPFTETDLEAAFDELRPHAQKLVDRFGQEQAFEILLAMAETVCPDGRDKVPPFRKLRSDQKWQRVDP
jgi:hypothetical protein